MNFINLQSPYLWLIVLAWLGCQESFGQQVIYAEGKVVNQADNQPIPYTHIRMKNAHGGTVTNADGKFKMYYESATSPVMVVSAIGYKTKEINLTKQGEKLTISLFEDITQLSEVVVVAEDEGQKLVQKAFENITKNYSAEPRRLSGFIREVVSKDTSQEVPYFISEAEISVSKAPYTKKNTDGEVQLIKGRKIETPQKDSLGMSIYAGAHLPHRFDVVSRHEPPLHPSDHKNFFFDLTDTLMYEGKYLFEVSFLSLKNDGFTGRLYILDSSFAIVKADYFYEKDAINGLREWISGNQRQYLHYTTEYLRNQRYWQLSTIDYRTAFLKSKDQWIYLNSRYVTHGSTKETESIPYTDQIQFRDYLLETVGNMEDDYWEERNILLADDVMQDYFEKYKSMDKSEVQSSKAEKWINTLSRFVFEYQLVGFSQSITDFSFNFQQQDFQYAQTVPDHTSFTANFSTIFNFKMTRHWYVGFQTISSFERFKHQESSFITSLRFNLRPDKRPLYVSPSIAYSAQLHTFGREKMQLKEAVRLGGKNFHSGEANIFAAVQRRSIQPGLSLLYERNRRIIWTLGAKYDVPLETTHGMQVHQRRNIFRHNRAFIPTSNPNLLTTTTPRYVRDLLLYFGLEIRI